MTEEVKSELQLLKEQADALGVEYPNNVTIKSLKKKITEHLNKESVEESNQHYQEHYTENMKLVRVIVTPVDSAKRDYQGEYFCVGNELLGTVKRFVPFNEEWMVENILVKHIKSKEFQFIQSKDGEKGTRHLVSKIIPAYNVTILPSPTKAEIEDLKRIQEAREGV